MWEKKLRQQRESKVTSEGQYFFSLVIGQSCKLSLIEENNSLFEVNYFKRRIKNTNFLSDTSQLR